MPETLTKKQIDEIAKTLKPIPLPKIWIKCPYCKTPLGIDEKTLKKILRLRPNPTLKQRMRPMRDQFMKNAGFE